MKSKVEGDDPEEDRLRRIIQRETRQSHAFPFGSFRNQLWLAAGH